MEPIEDFADDRLLVGCVYCAGMSDLNEEHAPSRALLDRPLPDFPPKLLSCKSCNAGYSLDEEYFAVFLGCVLSGTTDPNEQQNGRVAKSLLHSPALRLRIESAGDETDGVVSFRPEVERVTRVVRKLAEGHAAYELSMPQRREPSSIEWIPISQLSPDDAETWEAPEFYDDLPEVGSRGMQRALVVQARLRSAAGDEFVRGFIMNDWVTVQEGVYRYHVSSSDTMVRVRITIREFLACEVCWSDEQPSAG